MNTAALERELKRAFGGSGAERRVIARQARDLADSGKPEADRGDPLTVEEVVEELRDAPSDASLPERWNWWLGSLEAAHGGYERFEVRRLPED